MTKKYCSCSNSKCGMARQ